MNRSITRHLTVATILVLAACGSDDGTGPDANDLSEQEAAALGAVVVGQALASGFSAFGSAFGVQTSAMAVPFSNSVDNTEGCPLGGSVAVSGNIVGDLNIQGGPSTITMGVSMTHQGCQLQDPSSGMTFTIDGAPSLTTDLSMVVNADGSTSYSGGFGGAVTWSLGARSGTCSMAINFSGSVSSTGVDDSSLSGTVCGQAL